MSAIATGTASVSPTARIRRPVRAPIHNDMLSTIGSVSKSTTKITRVQLIACCEEKGISGVTRKTKAELIHILEEVVSVETVEEYKSINSENESKTYIMDEPVVKVEQEMNSESVHNMLIRIIQLQKEKEEKQDIWNNSPYKDLVKLQSNNVGNVGEELINGICKASGIDADCNGAKTKQIGGGEGDGKIMGIPVEIKTAHQGSSSPSFQHELGEVPWNGGNYMIFVDIAPSCIYLTIFNNFTEETYKSKEKLPCFPTKTITWRKEKGAFKLDTTVKINEQSIESGHAIKITPTTSNDTIASFIRRIIV